MSNPGSERSATTSSALSRPWACARGTRTGSGRTAASSTRRRWASTVLTRSSSSVGHPVAGSDAPVHGGTPVGRYVRPVEDDAPALEKMRSHGAHPVAVDAFARRVDRFRAGDVGLVPGDELTPVGDLPRLEDLPEPDPGRARAVLDQLAVIKVNGGLGTSMGLDGPKSLLPVKDGRSFLEIVTRQVAALRREFGARLPLVLMNSAATRDASLAELERLGLPAVDDLPADFLQGWTPKLRADDGEPVSWPDAPHLEWCPPGHGDIFTSLVTTGMRDRLLAAGVRWCFVSNVDNLGARPDLRIAAWMADGDVPFVSEAVRGTAADRKGGHLARRDGQLYLRESAQVPAGDDSFGDVERWRWFNTNNLWFDLRALTAIQDADPTAPHLPLIVNRKTVDPTDRASTPVVQLESAMGAAVGSIPGARAVEVPRRRFAPVKTTDDLLVCRSDVYALGAGGEMEPVTDGPLPVVSLDRAHYAFVGEFEKRFPSGPPAMRACRTLTVRGDVVFGRDVVARGDAVVDGPATVPDGAELGDPAGP